MTTKMAETLHEITAWPMQDQIDLMNQVWAHLADTGWQPELTEELKAELDRRLDDHEASPGRVVSWDDIVKHVRRPRY